MRIVFIGAGNVATHLAKSLDEKHDVVQVYSMQLQNAQTLTKNLKKAEPTDKLSEIVSDAEMYIISVKDDAIATVVDAIAFNSGLWVHTSGSQSIDLLKSRFDECGVLYPLQTFSKNVDVKVSEFPFFIEGCRDDVTTKIESIAKTISDKVYKANGTQRQKLHIAAVFGCNFVNYLWTISDEILQEAGYEFEILQPLINATLSKAIKVSPEKGQTGPARRGDFGVLKTHERILQNDKAEVYRYLSQCIMKKYNIDYE